MFSDAIPAMFCPTDCDDLLKNLNHALRADLSHGKMSFALLFTDVMNSPVSMSISFFLVMSYAFV